MKGKRLLFIGCGGVGRGLLEVLSERAALGDHWQVVGVCTMNRGSLYHPDGLDLQILSEAAGTSDLYAYPEKAGLVRQFTAESMIQDAAADFVLEMTPTDLDDPLPAFSRCMLALEKGKHLVTANKAPLVHNFQSLARLADKKKRLLGYEATVMSGTPAISLGRLLRTSRVLGITGILNGTTNYLLGLMEQGQTYEYALERAQCEGLAETDPTADVEGLDILAKLIILANAVFDIPLRPDQVQRKGMRTLTSQQVKKPECQGCRWKMVGSLKLENGVLNAGVGPMLLRDNHPLHGIRGSENGICFETEALGAVTLTGPGAGIKETGQGLFSDLQGWFETNG